jgi:hypothetical protein
MTLDASNSQWPYLTLKYWHLHRRFWIQVTPFDQSENVFMTLWLFICMWPYCGHFQVHISNLAVGLDWIELSTIVSSMIWSLIADNVDSRYKFQYRNWCKGHMRSKGRFPFSLAVQFTEPRKCLDSEYVVRTCVFLVTHYLLHWLW